MNNEFNQNTRTLIVSFVFALMVMIPLRFVEYQNNLVEPTVLGESVEVIEPKIEEPYMKVEELSQQCLSNEEVDRAIKFLVDETDVMDPTSVEIKNKVDEISNFEMRRCK